MTVQIYGGPQTVRIRPPHQEPSFWTRTGSTTGIFWGPLSEIASANAAAHIVVDLGFGLILEASDDSAEGALAALGSAAGVCEDWDVIDAPGYLIGIMLDHG